MLVQSFINYIQFEKRYSQHTVRAYTDDLEQFFLFLKEDYGEMPVSDIKTTYIRTWLASLKEAGLTAKSLNRKIIELRKIDIVITRVLQVTEKRMMNDHNQC
ncbi:MAG: hypothetical protein EOO85_29585 [Pedobacter sp.]|nr:MAG: hypothetical protein EOO85_29585 [Pedobacter sp.]